MAKNPQTSTAEHAVNLLFAHKLDSIRPIFKEHGLKTTGAKPALESRLTQAISERVLTADEIVEALDSIEGWGNQHVYLYSVPIGICKKWKNETAVRERLEKIGRDDLLNQKKPVLLPEEPTLSTIEWTASRVRFVWVEKREWTARRDELDETEGRIKYKAFESKEERGITSFDWDLNTGEASLQIQRLPSGENYEPHRQQYGESLGELIEFEAFTQLSISKAIKKLEKSKEVSNRQVEHETITGGTARFTSKGRKTDAFDDPALKSSRDALGKTASVLGNFYWIENPPHLNRSIHTKLYASDKRIGIFGECLESEVQYVLSRIRFHSK